MTMDLVLAATNGVEKYVDYTSLLKILAVGLFGGAGLIAVFSLGLVFLQASEPRARVPVSATAPADAATTSRNYAALVGSAVCFLIVVAGAAYGINVILSK